jgi:hypothetical protein
MPEYLGVSVRVFPEKKGVWHHLIIQGSRENRDLKKGH